MKRQALPSDARKGDWRQACAILVMALSLGTWMASARAQSAPEPRRSDFVLMSPELQAMQQDDSRNPAMLWVEQGKQLWTQAAGTSGRSCADCHGDVQKMRGVAVRYPAFDATSGGALTLAQRINRCRTDAQQAPALKLEGDELLALESLIALQSRGLPLAPKVDERLRPALELGRQLYSTRMGQLNLACMHCHDLNWGHHLGAAEIPQAHPVSYPQYRLEWQSVGSLERRLRNCLSGVRAQPWPLGAAELVALEVYLADRARGLLSEAPGIRP